MTAFEALIGFAPTAKLYVDAAVSLEEACLRWDTGDDLATDVERIEQVFPAEAGQWGQLTIPSASTVPASTAASDTRDDGAVESPHGLCGLRRACTDTR
ncbi:hypothetical protein [Micromonospora sp. NPDC005173]|uniref:hypothetical protein n=1 Tax=Micromonospora sp. NPDC005173 TaxID=3157165 RepID=UPI0033B61AFB